MSEQLVFSPSDFVDVFNQSTDYAFPLVIVEGEISSFRVAKNRWVYFDIKDEYATLRCFGTVYMLPGPLQDGMMVRIVCTPRLHPQFNFSLNIRSIVPVGKGELAKAAELVYKKLEAEGLFTQERKRTVQYPPRKVALISSVESAGYADFVKVSGARWPYMQIDAYDVLVQGASAPEQIIQRITDINQSSTDYDAVVLIRGGGSVEDLSAFSDERVVRAVAGSRVPTCVAIGHEVDESLVELVCDLRGSTPSNLAELMIPDQTSERAWVASSFARLNGALGSVLQKANSSIENTEEHLQHRLRQLFSREKEHLIFLATTLELLNPHSVLKRGYSLVKTEKGVIVKRGATLHDGEEVAIIFTDVTRKARIV